MTKPLANMFSPIKHRYNLALREVDAAQPQILDVGGYTSRGEIVGEHFNLFDYKAINIGSAWYHSVRSDFLYDGKFLPFDNNSFDYLISVDTLEHVPPSGRIHIVEEMIRVAKRRAIVVAPFRREGIPTDESYVLRVCGQHGIEPPPSLVEHELYGLPFLSDIENFATKYLGRIKYATFRQDYWHIQICMLWNSIVFQQDSEITNRKLQAFQEKMFRHQVDPVTADEAYRFVLIYDKI